MTQSQECAKFFAETLAMTWDETLFENAHRRESISGTCAQLWFDGIFFRYWCEWEDRLVIRWLNKIPDKDSSLWAMRRSLSPWLSLRKTGHYYKKKFSQCCHCCGSKYIEFRSGPVVVVLYTFWKKCLQKASEVIFSLKQDFLNNKKILARKEIFRQLGLWMMNFCLQLHTFRLLFILLFSPVWIKFRPGSTILMLVVNVAFMNMKCTFLV